MIQEKKRMPRKIKKKTLKKENYSSEKMSAATKNEGNSEAPNNS